MAGSTERRGSGAGVNSREPLVGARVRCLAGQRLLTHDGRFAVPAGAMATVSSVGVHGEGTVRAWLDRPRYEVPLGVGEWELVDERAEAAA